MQTQIMPGDVVRLKADVTHTCPPGREDNETATVRTRLQDVEGGLMMAEDLRGCRFWNVADLEIVHRGAGRLPLSCPHGKGFKCRQCWPQ